MGLLDFVKAQDEIAANRMPWLAEYLAETNGGRRVQQRYPHVRVQYTGKDQDPVKLVCRVQVALRKHTEATATEIRKFRKHALAGDEMHTIVACMQYVVVW